MVLLPPFFEVFVSLAFLVSTLCEKMYECCRDRHDISFPVCVLQDTFTCKIRYEADLHLVGHVCYCHGRLLLDEFLIQNVKINILAILVILLFLQVIFFIYYDYFLE